MKIKYLGGPADGGETEDWSENYPPHRLVITTAPTVDDPNRSLQSWYELVSIEKTCVYYGFLKMDAK